MTFSNQGIGGSAPRWLRLSRRGRQIGGIAIAVVGAGLMAGLTGCQPVSVAANSGQPHGGQSATSGGRQTTSSATSSSGTTSSTTSLGNGRYSFTTLDNPADPTFNQLLGFNNGGIIAGYFGSGAAGHPNKGYVLVRTRAGFKIMKENFPGSTQTQVTGLNDRGVTVGFWSDMNTANQQNDNFGFYWLNGRFHDVNFPTRDNSAPPVNQLLGVNDQDVAVGFYNDAKGNSHGYTFGIHGGWFHRVTICARPRPSTRSAASFRRSPSSLKAGRRRSFPAGRRAPHRVQTAPPAPRPAARPRSRRAPRGHHRSRPSPATRAPKRRTRRSARSAPPRRTPRGRRRAPRPRRARRRPASSARSRRSPRVASVDPGVNLQGGYSSSLRRP